MNTPSKLFLSCRRRADQSFAAVVIPRHLSAGLLSVALFVTAGLNTLAAQTPPDPAHAAHVAASTMPPDATKGDVGLAQQVSVLQAKVAQLEATLAKHPAPMASTPAAPMPGMPATASAPPPMSMGMDKMKSGGAMANMSPAAAPAPPMAGMSGAAPPAGGVMGMMSQMMGMMDKMMPMDPAAGAPMAGGSMPATMPSGGMGMMAMDKMEMAGMMGMAPMAGAAPDAMPQSTLPGFPGASHLYHIGATGFFLDHPQHISLTTQQQAGLNKAKEQAALAKSTADRAVEQAEQELWTLTSVDQPDAAAIQTKIAAIGKLRGDERLAFIRAVGDASKLLTDEQRKSLTGFAPPTPAAAMPAGAMKDM